MEKTEYQGEAHYKGYQYEPIKFITDMKFDFIQGNILKYLVRYRKKNGLQDLKKAKNYAEIGYMHGAKGRTYGSVLERDINLDRLYRFISQPQFDQQARDFLMILITLICNYQMRELAHLIDMQMAIEYPTQERPVEQLRQIKEAAEHVLSEVQKREDEAKGNGFLEVAIANSENCSDMKLMLQIIRDTITL